MKIVDILMVGVGGQGTVLSSDIVCDVALANGFDVKKSEIHGMAQRGGSVVSHVRFGEKVFSPVMEEKSADILISFEKMEFLRYEDFISESTTLLLNSLKIFPPSVAGGMENYPEDAISDGLKKFNNSILIDAMEIADKIGNVKVAGMVMLGRLAKELPFTEESWIQVISERVPPKTIDKNILAFKAGHELD